MDHPRHISMAYFSCSNQDPTFYSLMGFGWSEGTTTASLFSIIHTSFINVQTTIS
ncbi:hypothetical protein PTKIN_Ptkin04bG0093600 [Pterospermum kingtungense]